MCRTVDDHAPTLHDVVRTLLGSAGVSNRHFSRPLHRAFSGGARDEKRSIRHSPIGNITIRYIYVRSKADEIAGLV